MIYDPLYVEYYIYTYTLSRIGDSCGPTIAYIMLSVSIMH